MARRTWLPLAVVAAAVSADLLLGVLVPSLSDTQLQNAVHSAIADASAAFLFNQSVTPIFLETRCSDAGALAAWRHLPNVSAILGPICAASSCALVDSLLQLERPAVVHVNYGCSSYSCASGASATTLQIAPSDEHKLRAVAALASHYGQSSAEIAYVISTSSSFYPLLPLLLNASAGTASLLYVYDTPSSLSSVLTLVQTTQPQLSMLVFDGAETSPASNVAFVAAANTIFAATVGLVFVGLSIDVKMLKMVSPTPLTITVLSISMPSLNIATSNVSLGPPLSWSSASIATSSTTSTVNLLFDATYAYLRYQANNDVSSSAPFLGRTGLVTYLPGTYMRTPAFDLHVLVASTLATVGNFSYQKTSGSMVYTPISINFNWAPVTWSATNSSSLLPYGPAVLGVICILSACSFILLVRMFFSQSCLAARVFTGFSKQEKSGIEDPTQTQMVVTNLEKRAAERRVQLVLGLQTLLDMTQLITELIAYFVYVMVYDTNVVRIALYSIGLGVELASLPSLLMLRVPIFFRHSPWAWVLNTIKIKPTETGPALGPGEPSVMIRKHVHGRQSMVTTLVALQVSLGHLQQEHLEVANSLLRLWLQEVPLLCLNIYYVFAFDSSVQYRTSIVVACCVDFVALGFKTHLVHRLTELYVAQRGVHFDIQMAKLESKQRRSSYT
ncbi:hypothetical protein SDRG_02616 [Saprolegnia diclina VS20]|uniref:Receptor ligand binding region domain-containing protein n=1 Tax=Saprolegnia diclina (strain VS20) TaxID=1156394 RepID=T0R112_SAPDV|nr:hypothetical protein SDRG_02616 [Saprolegnia diclina VS20]EQC39960.1 hypothetical protein SDRG_02616 [Saprolegnia diclina VS20]|eukprot:XP_008606434.1 hypothetical protein SDRG_02616 [Saprolegnia diclina VS20]